MIQQITDALKTKFAGVDDKIIGRVAAKLAKTVTKAEDVATAVEGVTFQQLLESYGDSRATEATQTAVSNYEKKHGLKDGQKIEEEGKKPENSPANALTPESVQKLIDDSVAAALAPYREKDEKSRLSGLLNGHEKLKSIPEVFRNKYSLSKEEDLETVATQIEADYAVLKQDLARTGEFSGPPASGTGLNSTDDFVEQLHAMGESKK